MGIYEQIRYGIPRDIARRMNSEGDLAFLRSPDLVGIPQLDENVIIPTIEKFNPTIGRYWILRNSEGKLGPSVYKGWDSHENRWIAMKEKLLPGYDANGVLIHGRHYLTTRIMVDLAQYEGAHVCGVHDAGMINDGSQIMEVAILEYFNPKTEPTLEKYLAQKIFLTPSEAYALMFPVAHTVDILNGTLHVLHKDIKSQNIFVQAGEGVLNDFDVADTIGEGFIQGTYENLPPDWQRREGESAVYVSSTIDVYQTALVLYQCLTGKMCYRDLEPSWWETENGIHILTHMEPHVFEAFDRLYGQIAGMKVRSIYAKALAAYPNQRYVSAVALINDIATVLV